MQGEDVAAAEELGLAGRDLEAVGDRPLQRGRPRPDHNLHAEGQPVFGDCLADAAIAENAERLSAQGLADADLPAPRFERRDLLRDLACGRHDQRPGQFGCRIGWRARMLARRDDHAAIGAGVDIDMRVDAALADQAQVRQPLQQPARDFRALADEDQRFDILQPLGEDLLVLDMVGPDRRLIARNRGEAVQCAQRVEIIVQNRDLHRYSLGRRSRAFGEEGTALRRHDDLRGPVLVLAGDEAAIGGILPDGQPRA
jgi:hypothetical protein